MAVFCFALAAVGLFGGVMAVMPKRTELRLDDQTFTVVSPVKTWKAAWGEVERFEADIVDMGPRSRIPVVRVVYRDGLARRTRRHLSPARCSAPTSTMFLRVWKSRQRTARRAADALSAPVRELEGGRALLASQRPGRPIPCSRHTSRRAPRRTPSEPPGRPDSGPRSGSDEVDLAAGQNAVHAAGSRRHIRPWSSRRRRPPAGARRSRCRRAPRSPAPVAPKRSVLIRSGGWPSPTRASAAASTNAVGPQTKTRGLSAGGQATSSSIARSMRRR